MARLNDAFWSNEEAELLAIIAPLLDELVADGVAVEAEELATIAGVEIDWTATYADAAAWAREHAGELVSDIVANTRTAIGETVAGWIETPAATMGDLFDALGPDSLFAFSEARARTIAVTEVTSSYAEGGAIAARGLEEYFTIVKTWHTNNDGLVCPLCRPMNGQTAEGVDGDEWTNVGFSVPRPALHPNCRCWVTYSVKERSSE